MFASEFLGYIVLISGREGRAARAVLVSTGLNVVMNLLLVPRFGFIGAAVMTVFTEAVLVGQYVWALRSLMQKINWSSSLLRPLLAVALLGGLVPAERLAGVLDKFRYLKLGLAFVLVFVGGKMLLVDAYKVPIGMSLGVICVILGLAVLTSLVVPRRENAARTTEKSTL